MKKGIIPLGSSNKILAQGGLVFHILPKRIELMEFKKNRFRLRELFQKDKGIWKKTILQP